MGRGQVMEPEHDHMFDERGHELPCLACLLIERDRYKAALVKIANHFCSPDTEGYCSCCSTHPDTASDALKGGG
jgi:hypothetical protein